jgi:trans-aconitate 2-methyltransferase
MPHNAGSPASQSMKKLVSDSRWSEALAGASESTFVQPLEFYYEILRKQASRLNIWETEYLQIVDGPRAVLDWLRSTGMRPYLERLPDDTQRQQFEAMCLHEFERDYPANDQGKTLFPYKRMFIIAYR